MINFVVTIVFNYNRLKHMIYGSKCDNEFFTKD